MSVSPSHVVVIFLLMSVLAQSGEPDEIPTPSSNDTQQHPVAITLEQGKMLWDSITGFGHKYYTIDLPTNSFLDTVVIVERGHGPTLNLNATEMCHGWSVYMTVNDSIPSPQDRSIEHDHADLLDILIGAFIQLQQQSIFCDSFSAAKWSVKDASQGKWYVMVQTRGGSEQFDNSTCRFGVWVEARSRAGVHWIGALAIVAFCGWICWTLALAFVPALHPEFHIYRPSIFLHEFLFRLPVDLLYGLLVTPWRLVRACLRRLARRPRLGASALPTRSSILVDEEHTELATLVEVRTGSEVPSDGSGDLREPLGAMTEELHLHQPAPAMDLEDTLPEPVAEQAGPLVTSSSNSPPAAHSRPAENEEEEDCCRICGDNGAEEELIEPCACQGSMRFVHATCLNKWRLESLNSGRHQNALRCEVCSEPFNIVHPPIKLTAVFRSCMRTVVRIAYFLVAYAIGAYLWGWFLKYTIGSCACNAPYDALAKGFGFENIVVGIMYYAVLATHLYLCIFWRWVLWLNALRINNLPTQNVHFGTPKNIAFIAYFFTSFLFVEAGIGYTIKYLFFMFADNMVWVWDLPLTMGFLVVVFLSILSVIGLVFREALGGWSPMPAVNSLGTVTSRH